MQLHYSATQAWPHSDTFHPLRGGAGSKLQLWLRQGKYLIDLVSCIKTHWGLTNGCHVLKLILFNENIIANFHWNISLSFNWPWEYISDNVISIASTWVSNNIPYMIMDVYIPVKYQLNKISKRAMEIYFGYFFLMWGAHVPCSS